MIPLERFPIVMSTKNIIIVNIIVIVIIIVIIIISVVGP